jgi:hypothetical protein
LQIALLRLGQSQPDVIIVVVKYSPAINRKKPTLPNILFPMEIFHTAKWTSRHILTPLELSFVPTDEKVADRQLDPIIEFAGFGWLVFRFFYVSQGSRVCGIRAQGELRGKDNSAGYGGHYHDCAEPAAGFWTDGFHNGGG